MARRARSVASALLLVHALACQVQISLATAWDLVSADDGCPDAAVTSVLFQRLNLSHPGLEAAKEAVASGDQTTACKAVAAYYSGAKTAAWLRHASPPAGTAWAGGAVDEVALNDTYDFYGEVGRVPRNADGGLNWYFRGPVHDDEFMFALNRHSAWASFLDAWQATGNPAYARAFDARVADWVAHNLPGPASREDANTTWRTLEAGIRAGGSWPTSFFGFQAAAGLRASTRCSMVAAFGEHGRYLHEFGDAGNSNWRSMQYKGLATVALTLPELNNASAWFEHAQSKILEDMEDGVYPDGVEDEETAHYHAVALDNFAGFLALVRESGGTADPRVADIVERMWNYLALSLDPSGISPLNGDADTDNNTEGILAAAATFNRSDWLYIASHGHEGVSPEGNYSAMFPWAGQLVSRSGWEEDAQWSWFDVGPFGSSGHGHQCRTHLSVRLGSSHLLVDSGRFSYNGDLSVYLRDYGHVTRGHNVLLLSGKNQVETPAKALSALSPGTWSITEAEDRARTTIAFEGLPKGDTHTRSMVYVRGAFWVVVDRVSATTDRSVEGLWHTHPNCTVKIAPGEDQTVHVFDNTTRVGLDIMAVSGSSGKWSNVTEIRGQTQPVLQGWFSPTYGTKLASSALSYIADVGKGDTTFAWLLIPSHGATGGTRARVCSENATHVVVEIRYDFPPPAIGRVERNVTVEV